MPITEPNHEKLLHNAGDPGGLATLAYAGVISQAAARGQTPLIRALPEESFQLLLARYFPSLKLANGHRTDHDGRMDEFDDLLHLLLEHQAEPSQENTWLAYAMASAAMADDHLWQDMGLPSRKILSDLIARYFPEMKARNVGDMKWKKFFYRQLCERANIPICKSPSCAECSDYPLCFGSEDGGRQPVTTVASLRWIP